MESTRLAVCLCVCVFAGFVHGQVASLCRPNERLLTCGGCQKTCLDPVPDCRGVCKFGCYCEEDEVRNATGHCVKLSECPPLPPSYKLETTEPRPMGSCPPNEEYMFCEPCNRTCDKPDPVCPAQCSRGCSCKPGLVRDKDGRCVELEKCPNRLTNEIPHHLEPEKPVSYQVCGDNQVFKECSNCEKSCSNRNPHCPAQCSRGCFCKEGFYKAPNGDCVGLHLCPKEHHTENPIAYQLTCGPNQVYQVCQNCEKTCSNPNPRCPAQCNRGCFCRDGLFKAPDGSCVTMDDCPKAAEVLMSDAHELSIEDCAADEEYFSCGWCEPTCSDPEPVCPQVCMKGCLCKQPLLRHRSGHCVERQFCLPQRCLDSNEEFVCRYGCEMRCDGRTCDTRPLRCTLGCHCKIGFLRDSNGQCVTKCDKK